MSTPVSAIRRSRYGGTLVRPAVGLTPAPRLQSPQESLRLWYAQRPEVRLSSRVRNLIEPAKHIFNWQRPRIRYHYSPRGPQTVVGPRRRGDGYGSAIRATVAGHDVGCLAGVCTSGAPNVRGYNRGARIVARGKSFPNLTRPLCPHPTVARYSGGDPNSETSFVCKE
jgi:hypothetical protein